MKTNKKEIFGVTALILFMIFGYTIFISPHVKALKSIYSQYSSQNALVEQREEKRKILNALEKKNQELGQNLQSINSKFLKREEVTLFLESLYQLAIDSGNKLETLRPDDIEDQVSKNIIGKSVQLTLAGKFTTILQFIDRIQNNQKLITIDDLAINKVDDGYMLGSSLKMTFYVLVSEE